MNASQEHDVRQAKSKALSPEKFLSVACDIHLPSLAAFQSNMTMDTTSGVRYEPSLVTLLRYDGVCLGMFHDIMELDSFVRTAVADGTLPKGSYWYLAYSGAGTDVAYAKWPEDVPPADSVTLTCIKPLSINPCGELTLQEAYATFCTLSGNLAPYRSWRSWLEQQRKQIEHVKQSWSKSVRGGR